MAMPFSVVGRQTLKPLVRSLTGAPKHSAGIASAHATHETSPERPARGPSPRNISRADDQIGFPRSRHQARQRGWVVGEVGIHLGDEIGRKLQRPAKSGDIGRTKTALGRAVDDLDPSGMGGRERVCKCSSTVGRTIVDDQDAVARSQFEHTEDQCFDVQPLVIGWDDDDN